VLGERLGTVGTAGALLLGVAVLMAARAETATRADDIADSP